MSLDGNSKSMDYEHNAIVHLIQDGEDFDADYDEAYHQKTQTKQSCCDVYLFSLVWF